MLASHTDVVELCQSKGRVACYGERQGDEGRVLLLPRVCLHAIWKGAQFELGGEKLAARP